jgi:hypothetical protein
MSEHEDSRAPDGNVGSPGLHTIGNESVEAAVTDASRARVKRAALTTAKVLGGVLGGVALLLGLGLSLLQTDWGGERLRRSLLKRVNAEIRGQLDVARLTFRTSGLGLSGVRLSDPAGRPIALVGTVRVQFRLGALLHKEVRVTDVLLDRPALNLVSDEGELNLAQALEARHPKPRKAPSPRRRTTEDGWVIRVDRFDLHEGSVQLTTIRDETAVKRVALSQLETTASLRYATGNGNLQAHLRLGGDHTVDPIGSFDIQAQALVVTDSVIHVLADGHILDSPLHARLDMKPGVLGSLDGELALAVPARHIRGAEWGPVRIDGRARPGQVPKVSLAVVVPGIELTGKSDSDAAFDFKGLLACRNLAATANAISGLTGGDAAPVAGSGRVTFALGGKMVAAPAGWQASWDGTFDRLDLGSTLIRGFSFGGGFKDLALDFRAAITAPEPLQVAIAATVDRDRRGATLRELSLGYPQAKWALEKPVRLRREGEASSMSALRLISGEQLISLEGSQGAEGFRAAVAIERFRLDRLPALLAPPRLHLAGVVDATATAAGRGDDLDLHANLGVSHLRVQQFDAIDVKAQASMADQRLVGALDVRAPFATLDATFETTATPLEPGAPLTLDASVGRLDLGDVLAKVQRQAAAPADGAITARLRMRGSADNPDVDVTLLASRLRTVAPKQSAVPGAGSGPAAAATGNAMDIGEARLHLTYDRRIARAKIAFTSSHGGDLTADASAKVDLSYPRVTRLPKPAKIPIEGQVTARDFDVAWAAAFSERIETMSGRVGIKAKLAGTVADPQFVGDVRWKDGHVVTTSADRARPGAAAVEERRPTPGPRGP